MNELSIIIPILNESKNIKRLIPEINKIKKKLNLIKFEVLLIDDNSDDDTKIIVNDLKKKFSFLKLYIRNDKIKDLSKSCILGFNISKYENILVMDGDFQHHPKYIFNLYTSFNKNNYDFVIGSRNLLKKKNSGLSIIRKLFSIILIFMINLLLGQKTSDPMSGFFIFKKKFFRKNRKKMYSKGYKILSDLLYSSSDKLNIKDVDIKFDRRIEGKSKMNHKILIILLLFIFKKFFVRILN